MARLAGGDATVDELAAPYDVTVQAVSKHLKVLEDAGLVSRSRTPSAAHVHLEAEVFDLMTEWIERYRQQAEESYRRLDDVRREMPHDEGLPDAVALERLEFEDLGAARPASLPRRWSTPRRAATPS